MSHTNATPTRHDARNTSDVERQPAVAISPPATGRAIATPMPGARVRDPEREPGHPRVPARDRRRRADERELQPERHEHGVGEDDERDLLREIDGEPAGREQHHRGREEIAIGPLVVGAAQQRARHGGHDEEHRPGGDRERPADPELVREGDRDGRERVQPAVGDRADHERAHQREGRAPGTAGDREGHPRHRTGGAARAPGAPGLAGSDERAPLQWRSLRPGTARQPAAGRGSRGSPSKSGTSRAASTARKTWITRPARSPSDTAESSSGSRSRPIWSLRSEGELGPGGRGDSPELVYRNHASSSSISPASTSHAWADFSAEPISSVAGPHSAAGGAARSRMPPHRPSGQGTRPHPQIRPRGGDEENPVMSSPPDSPDRQSSRVWPRMILPVLLAIFVAVLLVPFAGRDPVAGVTVSNGPFSDESWNVWVLGTWCSLGGYPPIPGTPGS